MIIGDFGGDHSAQSIAQLEQLLGVRFKELPRTIKWFEL